ncbi:MAG: hypothetical protein JWN38_540 [Candidatus Saccharibacteria bacterium]|nr:hypothetical protein [Candidatus Saccharibacteria bacterium]
MPTVGAAESDFSFVGTLVKRQYKPGQRYVQFLFENDEDSMLTVSRNLRLIRGLKIGGLYRVEGPEYELGDKRYIQEPSRVVSLTYAAPEELPSTRSLKLAMMAAFASIVVVVGLVLVFGVHNGSGQLQARATAKQTKVSTTDTSKDTSKSLSPTTAAGATASAKVNTTPTEPTPTSAATNATPTTPDCDIISIAYTVATPVEDPAVTSGVVTIINQGHAGQKKVCYPTGRSGASVTTVITQPVDQTSTIGTYVAPVDPPPADPGTDPPADPSTPDAT